MIVCVCHGVSDKTLDQVIASGAQTLDAVTAATRAGTNCGECKLWIADRLWAQKLARAGVKAKAPPPPLAKPEPRPKSKATAKVLKAAAAPRRPARAKKKT